MKRFLTKIRIAGIIVSVIAVSLSFLAQAKEPKNVRDFGARGDCGADDTAAINSALAGGGDVYLPAGTYCVTSALIVGAPTTLTGAGAGVSIIQMLTPGPGNTIEIASSNVTIADLTVQGPTVSDVYVAGENGINTCAVAQVPFGYMCATVPSSTGHLRKLRLVNLEVLNYGFNGITLHRVTDTLVSANRVHRIGYAAIACLSCTDVVVSKNFIQSVKPGFANEDAYGIYFSHLGKIATPDNPVSTRCIADGNIIRDIPSWSALDTHAGSFITFSNNVIQGTRLGIHAGAAEGDSPPQHISIIGNTMVADPPRQHFGIVVSSGQQDPPASNAVVVNNVVDGYGMTGNAESAAIKVQYTNSTAVIRNVVKNFGEAGIQFYGTTNFMCLSNRIFGKRKWGVVAIRINGLDKEVSGFVVANRSNGFGLDITRPPTQPNVEVWDNDL